MVWTDTKNFFREFSFKIWRNIKYLNLKSQINLNEYSIFF